MKSNQSKRNQTILVMIICLMCLIIIVPAARGQIQLPDLPENVYLFTSFGGDGGGLHMSWSTDARKWNELHGVFLVSKVGSGLMRDPFVLRGQGRQDSSDYQMVWTTGWSDKGIGYASTQDFVHWSIPRYLPFMEDVNGTRNCWAPEIFYDDTRREYMITWSSSVDGRFSETESDVRMNNRTYYVTTQNFRNFSKPQVLIDPGFDHIDTTITKDGNQYIAVIKEGDKQSTGEWGPIHILTASDPHGPWTLQKPPIVTERAEGPALVKVNNEKLLYFDYYGQNRYGARATKDWTSWRDVSSEVEVVEGQRHGTIIEVPSRVLEFLLVRNKGWEIETPPSVVPVNTADPSVRVFGDRYYLYPTTDQPNWMTTEFNVWSSPNLIDWKFENTIIDLTKQIDWADIRAWAPDCIERNGKYYFYFCGDGKIGVAASDSPTGPFKDALGRPLLTRQGQVRTNTIDPWAFIDDDGQAYLYFGQPPCHVYKLNDDMISFDGDPVVIQLREFREGIVVFKRNGKYYFMWSIDDARSPNYRVGWGTADSPFGPVKSHESREEFIVLEKNEPVIGTAHHSVFNVPGTDRWYVAYHRHAIKNGGGYNRQTVLARMLFDDNGNILPMNPMVSAFKPGDRGEPIINGKGLPEDPLTADDQ
ncbi:MAG: family 43 glycosylhydrolase [Sedimentisphaerales bacterium]|nr:family 43 glycosylhydrolase [Sedimentisphaerales bacterium]